MITIIITRGKKTTNTHKSTIVNTVTCCDSGSTHAFRVKVNLHHQEQMWHLNSLHLAGLEGSKDVTLCLVLMVYNGFYETEMTLDGMCNRCLIHLTQKVPIYFLDSTWLDSMLHQIQSSRES